jgi:hypothetical protein
MPMMASGSFMINFCFIAQNDEATRRIPARDFMRLPGKYGRRNLTPVISNPNRRQKPVVGFPPDNIFAIGRLARWLARFVYPGQAAGSNLFRHLFFVIFRAAELTSPVPVSSLFAQRHALCPEFAFGDFYCRW